jgi:hypothetical protein
MVVTIALAGGAAVGGVIATRWGYLTVFGLFGIGRLGASLLFARFVHDAVSLPAARSGESMVRE